MRLWVCCVLAILSIAARGHAEAPLRPALNWVRLAGSESCIDAAELGRRVEALSGRALVTSSNADLVLEAHVRPHLGRFEARVRPPRDAEGRVERVLVSEPRDCRTLDEALVFVLALLVEPTLADDAFEGAPLGQFAREQAPERELLAELKAEASRPAHQRVNTKTGESELAPLARSDGVVRSQRSAPEPRREPPAYVLRANVGASLLGLVLPEPTWGLATALALQRGRLTLQGAARIYPRSDAEQLDSEREVRLTAAQVSLGGCLRLGALDSLRVASCVGPELDVVRGRGSGFTDDRSARLLLPSGFATLELQLAISAYAGLWVELAGRVAFRRPALVAELAPGVQVVVHRPERLAASASFGPYVAF